MNNITSAPNIINCGNPSSTNLKVRNRMKDNKETTSEIFAKLNKRGKLDPRQNAMNYQLTNDQLFRFYVQDVEPKLEKSNETNGENPNDLLKKEIQRLINVGDTKNDVMTKLLQGKFSDLTQSVNTAGTTPPSAAAIAAAIAGVLPAAVAGPSASDIASAIAGALAAAGIGSAPVSGIGSAPVSGTGPPVTGPPVTGPPVTGPSVASGGGAGGGPPVSSGASGGTSGGAGTGPPAASGVSGGTSGVSVPSTAGGSTVAFAPSVTIAPSITSTAALASSAAAASTAGSGLLVMTPGTSAAASALLSLGTSTTTNISLPIKGGTGQEYSLPVTTYLKINSSGNWSTKKNEWPSLGDHVGSRSAWDRIIPNLDNSDFQLRLDKMNEFVLQYPKPKDFLDAYKSANAGFGTGSVSSPSPAPSGGAAGGVASASPSPNSSSVLAALGLPSASSSPAATGTALFPPLLTKAQRWAAKARSAGADAAAYTAATGVNTVLFSDGSFGSSSRFGS
jgi:hypothetical protein